MKYKYISKLATAGVALAFSASMASATCIGGFLCPTGEQAPLSVTGWTGTGTNFTGQGGTLDSDGGLVSNPNITVNFNDAWANTGETADITVFPSGLCGDEPCPNGGDTFSFDLQALAEGGHANSFGSDESGVPLAAVGGGGAAAMVGLIVDQGDTSTQATLGLEGGYLGTGVANGTGDDVQMGAGTSGSAHLAVGMNSGGEAICPDFGCGDVTGTGAGTVNSGSYAWSVATGTGAGPVTAGTNGSNAVTVGVVRGFETGPIPAPSNSSN